MEYSVELARAFVGRRVIVSLRHVNPDGSSTYSGFWGVVESAHVDGLQLLIEGGLAEPRWALPPDLAAFQPAQHDRYELGESGHVVADVDYEMYWSVAANPADFSKLGGN